MARVCPVCGEEALEQREGSYVFAWPEGFPVEESSFVDAAWEVCTACGEELLPPELNERVEAEQYRVQGLLTPEEVKAVRVQTGLSQTEMARLLGVGAKTYARWEGGLSVQNRSMDNLIRVAATQPEVLAKIEVLREPDRTEQIAAYIRQIHSLKARNPLALAAHGDLSRPKVFTRLRQRLAELLAQREETPREA